MKRGLYAVYGSNAAAIFTSWQLVLENKHEFFGFKNKKCKNAEEAADYIAHNLAFDYGVIAFSHVLNNNNRFYKEFEPNTCVAPENGQEVFLEEEAQLYVNDSTKPITTDEILKLLLKIVNEVNAEMTAKCVMNAVNNFQPMDKTRISRSEEVGKVLRKVFGEELKDKRIKGNMCYNLNWKGEIGNI